MTDTSVSPVYALYGDEPFLARQALASIVLRAMGDDPGAMGPRRIDGQDAELADALDELQTPSLLGGIRMVVVDQADAFITRYRKQLEQYCSTPAFDACLILLCRSLPRNTRLYKIIASSGKAIECASPKGPQVSSWLTARCRDEYGKKLDRDACAKLRDLVGNGLEALDNELAKLSVYVGGRPGIALADVDDLVGQHREEIVFRVTDAMASGDVPSALNAWEQVLATDRAAPMRAIAGLAAAVRRLLEAKQEVDAGASPHALAARFGPNRAAFLDRLNKASARRLQDQLADLYEADIASKTGLTSVDRAIEGFIVKHAAG